jgi:hypothetical protein
MHIGAQPALLVEDAEFGPSLREKRRTTSIFVGSFLLHPDRPPDWTRICHHVVLASRLAAYRDEAVGPRHGGVE